MRQPLRRVIVLVVLITGVTKAEDWPTYRHDNGRTGGTTERLTLPLSPLWTIVPVHKPVPSWPTPGARERPRVHFDDVFHVAIVDNTVFFGSSATGAVRAFDAITGTNLWTFLAGGAVRLAPAVWERRVYVTSDDGLIYCLSARDGKVLWQRRASGSDEQVVGHGRIISAHPPRGGVVVADGTAYFAYGIFPTEGVGLCAVDAATGTPVWSNTGFGQRYQRMAHGGTEGFCGVSPQGYMLASDTTLFVCSGRSVPAAFARKGGELLYWKGATHHEGGTWALLAGETLYSDADRLLPPNAIAAYYQNVKGLPPVDGTRLKRDSPRLMARDGKTGEDLFVAFPGDRVVVTDKTTYTQQNGVITAIDRQAYDALGAQENALAKKLMSNFWKNYKRSLDIRVLADRRKRRQANGEDLPKNELEKLAAAREEVAPGWTERDGLEQRMHDTKTAISKIVRWRCTTELTEEIIVAGDTVFVGGANQVGAIRATDGQLVWTQKVTGNARGLAVANGRLVVSTDSGHIHCFSTASATTPPPAKEQAGSKAPPKETPTSEQSAYSALFEAIPAELKTTRGIALVYGCDRGALIGELVAQTDLYVVGYDPVLRNVLAARQDLLDRGILGRRCAVFQANLQDLPCPPYVANLVVSGTMAQVGRPVGSSREIRRVLRPCGGLALLGQPLGTQRALDREALNTWWGEQPEPNITEKGGLWLTFTAPPLARTAEWTHQYADAANTGCSGDDLVTAPFALQWFGRPGMAKIVDRHQRAAAPLYANGRLYHQGINYLFGIDAYNGTVLWERWIQGAQRKGLSRAAGNMCATPGHLFVTVGSQCLKIDGATGKTLSKIAQPSAEKGRLWGWIASRGDQLYGSCGKDTTTANLLFCLDNSTGNVLWQTPVRQVRNSSIAMADQQLFFLESRPSPQEKQAAESMQLPLLPNDPKPGVPLPSQPYYPRGKTPADVRTVVALDRQTGKPLWRQPLDLTGMGKEPTLCVSRGTVLVAANMDATRFIALDARDGTPRWTKKTVYFRRPVIVEGTIYTLPFAHDLATGALKMRTNPITGTETPFVWTKAYGCGGASASNHTLFFRSGSLGFYDITQDSGVGNVGGLKPSCWISQIPAGGLWLAPEGSAGCSCAYPIRSSMALRPVAVKQDWWTHYVKGIDIAPVRQLRLNVGAPGDRRDSHGRLWLSWPRPKSRLTLKLPVTCPEGAPGAFLTDVNAPLARLTDRPWLHASGSSGPITMNLALRKPTGTPHEYAIRLHYGVHPGAEKGECTVSVVLTRTTSSSPPVTATVGMKPTVLELVAEADGELTVHSSATDGKAFLCGVEIERR